MIGDDPTRELCLLLGVETEYVDNSGVRRSVPSATLVALFAALGYPAATPDEAQASIERFRGRAVAYMMEPVVVCRDDEAAASTYVTLPTADANQRLRWDLALEAGGGSQGETRFADLALVEQFAVGGQAHEKRRLDLPGLLPLGYHRVRVGIADRSAEGTVIVAPRQAYVPPALASGRGIWGIAVQLYSLRSARNWGVGDLTDLGDFVRHAAAASAGAISLNPLHALFPDDPEAASPYSPSSRLYSNVLYLDVEAIEDFAECPEAQAQAASPEWQADLQRLRDCELVDYVQATERKLLMFERLYRSFRSRHLEIDDPRAGEFRAYQGREGTALRRFAVFHALREFLGKAQTDIRPWRAWPAEFRDPDSPAVMRFAIDNLERIEFFEYLQWQFDRQLETCAATAQSLGMPIGLYSDLAVGVDANGAEAWASQNAIVSGWSVGAPPDPWNMKGQSWGLPPFDPLALRALAYQPLIDTFRANMRHAGALRIDHILGFRRLFWIPAGAPPSEGVYVRNPFDDIVGVLALESHRHQCLIIGEDLGTLPEGLREQLAEAAILSYRLLYFEREIDGTFCQPAAYPRQALVAVGTHDLPTLPAYWKAVDLELKSSVGLYARDQDRQQDEEQRRRDRDLLTEALRWASLPVADGPAVDDAPPVESAYRFLARTPSQLLMIHLEDALGIREQINLPGTVQEHPNWRRRLPLPVAALFDDPRVRRLLRAVDDERPRGRARTGR
jgi:4-alpha-glucanotransferase